MSVQFFFPDRDSLEPDSKETARYLGYRGISTPDDSVRELISVCQEELQAVLVPKAVYADFDLELKDDSGVPQLKFADVTLSSVDLWRNLKECTRVVLFAATIGSSVDSLIRRTQRLDSVRAAVLQAAGAMFAECLVQQLNLAVREQAALSGFLCRPRYSPGYGDVPLSVQKDFFRLLPAQKIGLTLMDTLIMAPEKSVTAFVGLKPA